MINAFKAVKCLPFKYLHQIDVIQCKIGGLENILNGCHRANAHYFWSHTNCRIGHQPS